MQNMPSGAVATANDPIRGKSSAVTYPLSSTEVGLALYDLVTTEEVCAGCTCEQ